MKSQLVLRYVQAIRLNYVHLAPYYFTPYSWYIRSKNKAGIIKIFCSDRKFWDQIVSRHLFQVFLRWVTEETHCLLLILRSLHFSIGQIIQRFHQWCWQLWLQLYDLTNHSKKNLTYLAWISLFHPCALVLWCEQQTLYLHSITGPWRGSLGESFVPADWQVSIFGSFGLVDRHSDCLYIWTIPLYGYMYRLPC